MARVLFELAALDLLDDVDKQLVGAGLMPTCFPSHTAKPVKRSISVRRPSAMFWPIDGRWSGRAAAAPAQPAPVIRLEGHEIALAGPGDHLGRQMVDLFELIAVRLADLDRFVLRCPS